MNEEVVSEPVPEEVVVVVDPVPEEVVSEPVPEEVIVEPVSVEVEPVSEPVPVEVVLEPVSEEVLVEPVSEEVVVEQVQEEVVQEPEEIIPSIITVNKKKNSFNNLIKSTPLQFDPKTNFPNIKNILLIHDQIEDYNSIITSCNSETFPIVYSTKSDSIELITLLKNNIINIRNFGLIFHCCGNINKIFLDNKPLFTENDLKNTSMQYSSNMELIINLIQTFNIKNMDYFACNSLNYPRWKKYYDLLKTKTKTKTNTIISASNDETGNVKYGGDWILENTHENVQNIYFTNGILEYNGLLSIFEFKIDASINLYLNMDYSFETIQYSTDEISWSNIIFPCIINNIGSGILTVKLKTNLIINDINQYFTIGTDYITFECNNYTVSVNNVLNYPGLINNPTYENIIIQNLGVNSIGSTTLKDNAGWIGQHFFYGGTVINCYSTGIISTFSGGIFGYGSSGTATNCYSTGTISNYSGGIFGYLSEGISTDCYSIGDINGIYAGGIFGYGSSGTSTNCYSTGIIGWEAGGIYGTASSGTAINCYSTGIIGLEAGGIYGSASSGISTNCYSTGDISGTEAGGIYGYGSSGTATNCYSTGDISGTNAGGIYGNYSIRQATNCYSSGFISGTDAGGIYGPDNPPTLLLLRIPPSYCYIANGSWSDTDANANLDISGTVWTDISSNTNVPYLLTSFNAELYIPNTETITNINTYTSSNGILSGTYSIISVNDSLIFSEDFTINSSSGQITFTNILTGTYVIKVLCFDSGYNINNYTLIVTNNIIIDIYEIITTRIYEMYNNGNRNKSVMTKEVIRILIENNYRNVQAYEIYGYFAIRFQLIKMTSFTFNSFWFN